MILDITNLIKKPIVGIVQVGAHTGNEIEQLSLLTNNIVLFEPQKNVYAVLCENIKKYSNIIAENLALGSEKKYNIKMYKEYSNSGMSSSILEPHIHKTQYPWITFDGVEYVSMTTLDEYFIDKKINFNVLIMDVQGYELQVLLGAKENLKKIDYVYCEINRAELYKDCAKVEELDNFLSEYGFKRTFTDWAGETWGDALYEKD